MALAPRDLVSLPREELGIEVQVGRSAGRRSREPGPCPSMLPWTPPLPPRVRSQRPGFPSVLQGPPVADGWARGQTPGTGRTWHTHRPMHTGRQHPRNKYALTDSDTRTDMCHPWASAPRPRSDLDGIGWSTSRFIVADRELAPMRPRHPPPGAS